MKGVKGEPLLQSSTESFFNNLTYLMSVQFCDKFRYFTISEKQKYKTYISNFSCGIKIYLPTCCTPMRTNSELTNYIEVLLEIISKNEKYQYSY